MTAHPGLSVIVPAYNEEASLAEAILAMVETVAPAVSPLEIVIVDDGSEDRTGDIAETLSHALPGVRVVHHAENAGWGQAVRTGIANAKQEFLVLAPVDNPITGEQARTFLAAVDRADVVIGYRTGRAGYSPWLRLGSRCYTRAVRMLFRLPYRDVNWIHVYRKTAIERLPLRLSGIVFPAEVVAKAHRRGYRIVEVHSEMKPRMKGRATVSRPKVIVRAMRDLVRLWREMRRPEWS
ncbi:MAG: glycosyltransferase family 2 protein [Candidatus Rokubacteria bacterium]|nr:glycosyltransferase family 2 protein [Candidatus Rokubacteria bacterium]